MKTLSHIMYGLFTLLLIGVALLFFVPSLPIAGGIDIKIVKSGSMEPAIMTGGIVVIRESATYVPGDIVTFMSAGGDIPTTHRILSEQVEGGKTMFVTKGDANEEQDTEPALRENVIGKVLFTVPYLGYVLDFARQPLGFAILIGLPALLIVIDEIEKIWKELRRRREPKIIRKVPETLVVAPFVPAPRVRMMDIGRPVVPHVEKNDASIGKAQTHKKLNSFEPSWAMATAGVLIIVTVMANLWSIEGTVSYFNDIESSTENALGANALDFTAQPDGTSFTFTDGVLDDSDGLITLVAPQTGSVPMKHSLKVEFISGNQLFCDAIQVTTGAPISYTGTLSLLSATDLTMTGPWTLGMSLGSGAYLQGDLCVVDIVYTGWNALLVAGNGYFDEERTRLTFTAPVSAGSAFRAFGAPTLEPLLDTVLPEDTDSESSFILIPAEGEGGEMPQGSEEVITPEPEGVPEETPEPAIETETITTPVPSEEETTTPTEAEPEEETPAPVEESSDIVA